MFKSWCVLVIKKKLLFVPKKKKYPKKKKLIKKIHGYLWIPLDTSPAGTRIVGTHEDTGQTRVSYLSNEAGMCIILSVPIGAHWHPYLQCVFLQFPAM